MGTCEDRGSSIDLVNDINLSLSVDSDTPRHADADGSSEQALIQKLEDSHIEGGNEGGDEEGGIEEAEEEGKPEEIERGGRGTDEERTEIDGPGEEEEKEEEEDGYEDNEMGLQNEIRDLPYPVRLNAEDCSFYMKTGSCKFGLNCRFNHPLNRINQGVDVDIKDHDAQGADDSGKIECKYYSTPGGCKYGDTCRFSHSRLKADNEQLELNFLGLPMRKGERECPYYMRNGSCGYGANCRFHHPDPMAAAEEPKNLMANGGVMHGGQSFAARDIAVRAPPMPSMPRPISNASSSENLPSYMSWMNASITQGMPQFPAYNQYQVPVSLPDKTMNARPGYSVTSPLKKTDSFGFNPQLMQNEEYPERPGQPECDYFIKTGTCKFRSSCRFHHPKGRLCNVPNGATHNPKKEVSHLTYNTQTVQIEEYPERPGEPECSYFMRTGDCKYKAACKYHHPKSRNSASTYVMNGLPSRPVPTLPHEMKKLPDLYPGHLNQTAKPFKHHQQPARLEEFPDRPGQPECEYFMKTGDCKYKYACRYHHPKTSRSQVSTSSECALNEKGLPLRPGAKTCRNYEQLGICKYGPRCLFDHPSSSDSSATPEPPAPQSPQQGNNSGSEDWGDGWVVG